MCFKISTPRKGSLPFGASSMVKLIEGWLSFSVDSIASAVSTLSNYAQRTVHVAFVEIWHFALVLKSFLNTTHECIGH